MDQTTSTLAPDVEVLVTDWFRRVRESQRLHYECGNYFSRLNYVLGLPTIGLTAAVGTAVFASVENAASGNMRIVVGMVSIAATILASLQTFLGFAQRADRHRAVGAGYGAIRRSLEYLKTFPPANLEDLKRALTDIKGQMDNLAESGPEVPARIKKLLDQLKAKTHYRVFNLPGGKDTELKGAPPSV